VVAQNFVDEEEDQDVNGNLNDHFQHQYDNSHLIYSEHVAPNNGSTLLQSVGGDDVQRAEWTEQAMEKESRHAENKQENGQQFPKNSRNF